MARLLLITTAAALAACTPESGAPPPQADDGEVVAMRHRPSPEDREAVLGTLQALFDALGSGDGNALRSILHPDVVMHSVERAADGSRSVGTSTIDDLVARVDASQATLTERMFDPEVRISGDLAMVWTPYDFYIGSDLSHCGADAVHLVRSGDVWRITALSWTRLRPPACELHPEGPPSPP